MTADAVCTRRSIYECSGAIFPSQGRYLYRESIVGGQPVYRVDIVFNDPPTIMGIPVGLDSSIHPFEQMRLMQNFDPVPGLRRTEEIERVTVCTTARPFPVDPLVLSGRGRLPGKG